MGKALSLQCFNVQTMITIYYFHCELKYGFLVNDFQYLILYFVQLLNIHLVQSYTVFYKLRANGATKMTTARIHCPFRFAFNERKKIIVNGTRMKTKPKIKCKTFQLKWRRMIAFIVARNAIFPDGQEWWRWSTTIRGIFLKNVFNMRTHRRLDLKMVKGIEVKMVLKRSAFMASSKWESSVGKFQSLCIPFVFGWECVYVRNIQ